MGWFTRTPEQKEQAKKAHDAARKIFDDLYLEIATKIVNKTLKGQAYGILSARYPSDLSRLVNVAISLGYRPVGTIGIDMCKYYQPVEKI